ncbi:hypothetical protein NIES2119_06465 [[Phormidium ambiguum] IAM M-71]|uniref:DUF4335 domain-containing protein n=1 Tax=[Phormidium ambiguum] IAM M-71 TaxID=454136 RepID=A0A1U7IPR1_9CYAN|nr:DUF4335 domain-containing protein [Phormidium ambiguum]OKH39379.1 hypothetical protein NIES2119_06465 [Phormidium ambiguum IAM M-71]
MSSNSVLRRYTPPTCTLEIVSQGSPLHRWVSRSVLNQLNFSLNFDDPRLPEEQRVTINGDKTQLETLHQEVKAYIQNFLVQKPENFPGNQTIFPTQPQTPSITEADKDLTDNFPQTTQTELPPTTQENYQPTTTPGTTNLPPHNLNLAKANHGIYLQPRNLLSHDLFLGSLATPESGLAINLSLLQLFDLATALEEYNAEQKGITNNRRTTGRKLPPYWAISAAMVAATVGLTAGIAKIVDQGKRAPEPTPAVINPTADPNQTNPATQQPVVVVPSPLPAPTPGVVIATPTPGTTLQTLPSAPGLAGNQTPNPTNTPMLGNNTTGTPAQIPPLGITPTTPTSPLGTNGVTTTSPGGLPPGTYRIGSTPTGTPGFSPNPNTTSQGTINIPVNNNTTAANPQKPSVTSTPTRQAKPQTRNTPQNNSPSPTSVQMFPRETSPQLSPMLSTFSATPLATTPLPSAVEQSTQTPAKPSPAATPTKPKPQENPQLAGLGHQLGTSTAEPLFSNTLRRQQNAQTTETGEQKNSEVTATNTSDAPTVATLATDTTRKNSSAANPGNSNSLFDQIPQVAEARQFFEQRWQPPSGLTQEQIEYTLALNADGTIKQITPRGQVAQIYLDRTQMPLTGEPFVSPVDGGRTPEILLILHKNGKVETRLQTLN